MSRLAILQADLRDVSAAIMRAERTVARFPDVPSVVATLRSIQKRKDALEVQFAAAADELGLDTCSYRIEYEDKRQATIASVTASLNSFQKIFTNVYDAVVNGPKKRAKASAETIEATAFGFAYTFPGSIGFMMTLANERLLVDKTPLDMAMSRTFELIQARRPDEIESMTEAVGLPAIRSAYQWAFENAKAGFGADIAWQRVLDKKIEVRVQPQEVAELAQAMGAAIAKEQVTYNGDLVQVDMTDYTFEMMVDGKKIKGTFDKAISVARPAQLPKSYVATMTVSAKIVVNEGEEGVSYFLLRLDDPPPPRPLSLLATSS
jgi:hypothetical protein